MTKNILITRPEENAQEIAAYLKYHGFITFTEPLFRVVKLAIQNSIKKPSFIIITSVNACDFLDELGLESNIRIYAVGRQTAEKLVTIGFVNVLFPQENSAIALKNLIIREEKAQYGLYLQGSIISLDFAAELKGEGFFIENLIVYKTEELLNFSTKLLNFCQNGNFESVLIFSKNSAKIFCALARKHNLLEYFNQSRLLCFSEKILDEVRNSGFKNSTVFLNSPILKSFYDRRK